MRHFGEVADRNQILNSITTMKFNSARSFFTAAILILAVLAPAASRAAKTVVIGAARIAAPPDGKALVNIHRRIKGPIRCPIFDENGTFLMDLPAKSECQLVCPPGQNTFITWLGANPVKVMVADLAPDKTYDLLLDLDWKGVVFIPLTQASAKLRDPEKLEKKEAVCILERNEVALNYEASQKAHIAKIKADFLGGKKSDRVIHVSKSDCR
jgi:hypothetical protein